MHQEMKLTKIPQKDSKLHSHLNMADLGCWLVRGREMYVYVVTYGDTSGVLCHMRM